METQKIDLIQQSSDWDFDFTEEELQSIEAIIESATSSKKPVTDCDEDRPKTRRRLPDSLFNFGKQSTLSSNNSSTSSSLLPCPRNRFSNPHRDTMKMRYPAMAFKGRIVYSRTLSEVEKATDELLKFVETKYKDGGRAVIGLDIEWKPSFRKVFGNKRKIALSPTKRSLKIISRGVKQSKAAVLQICADSASCHVMHIIHSGFPQNLKSLLGDTTFLKVGVGIAGDARKVFNDHNVSVEALEDLSCLANQKFGGVPKMWGLSSLTEKLICKQVLKPNKIRLGNWEANPLSTKQLEYAATDAYVSWFLFEVLNHLPDADTLTTEPVEAMAPS